MSRSWVQISVWAFFLFCASMVHCPFWKGQFVVDYPSCSSTLVKTVPLILELPDTVSFADWPHQVVLWCCWSEDKKSKPLFFSTVVVSCLTTRHASTVLVSRPTPPVLWRVAGAVKFTVCGPTQLPPESRLWWDDERLLVESSRATSNSFFLVLCLNNDLMCVCSQLRMDVVVFKRWEAMSSPLISRDQKVGSPSCGCS